MAGDDKALDLQLFADDLDDIVRTRARLGIIILADHAADRHSGKGTRHFDGRLKMVAADIVKIDVNALRCGLPQCG